MKRGIRREDRHARRLYRHRPSNYIHPFDEIKSGDKVVLCCRVSFRHQQRSGNDDDQAADLRRIVATRGASVADVVQHTGSGADPTWLFDLLGAGSETLLIVFSGKVC